VHCHRNMESFGLSRLGDAEITKSWGFLSKALAITQAQSTSLV
jgi:hypothetical protein